MTSMLALWFISKLVLSWQGNGIRRVKNKDYGLWLGTHFSE